MRGRGLQPWTSSSGRGLSAFRRGVSVTVSAILARRAELTRELAALDEALAVALEGAQKPEEPDRILGLADAAAHVGEAASTFRQRPCYRRALVSAAGQRPLRFSMRALDKILRDRLAEVRS